ncbi:unannotated protein [freshwater metagenome]|uniref:Unannotated protein n=1 Tax=freshwater metagenome TaxID=449393 RepID=A0A6J6SA16_9ZZZZ|nr:AAA family ATPase [Actinomycetota bacterium]
MNETTALDTTLAEEKHHLEVARAALGSMLANAAELAAAYQDDFEESRRNRRPGDARPDHNMGFAMSQYRARRLEDLADDDVPLFFGRLWTDEGEDHHLGRRHVRDEDDRTHPLVVDWRAPIGERFYRATAHDRRGVARRRRFGFDGPRLTGFEDERLDGTGSTSAILEAEIERPRSGPMRDIVATIQPDQDELIRRDMGATLCVQGAPGTGKTAVGLHRAAWLLYTHRRRLSTGGLLVLGPSSGFLDYIAGVLPMLGERAVQHSTVDALLGTDQGVEEDLGSAEHRAAERLKHDARMVEVLARAVDLHRSDVTDDHVVRHGGIEWYLRAEEVRPLTDQVAATARSWSSGRTQLAHALSGLVQRQSEQRTGRLREAAWLRDLRKQPDFVALLDQLWPRLTPTRVLRRLQQDPDVRRGACEGLLSTDEQELLALPRRSRRPTRADLLVMDELRSLLSAPRPQRTWDHVVIDEAQDLSPMQCRAVARHCPDGSFTVLGDLAQGTTPWSAPTWRRQLLHLGHSDAEVLELTRGYRVPTEVLQVANALLPHLDVHVPPATSMRSGGRCSAHAVARSDDLSTTTQALVERLLALPGLTGVISSTAIIDLLGEDLAPDPRLHLVPAHLVKGLEFDHVVVVEPAALLERDADLGLRHLYIAVTRAVMTLDLVHSAPLPDALELVSDRPGRGSARLESHATVGFRA